MQKPSILIIGGGVIGAAAAYELSRVGCPVTLLEKKTVASQASGVSAALLEAQLDIPEHGPFREMALASRALFPQWAADLKKNTGIDIGYERCGLVRLALTAEERDPLRERYRWQKAQGLSVEWWDSDDFRRKVPGATVPEFGALFYADDGQLTASLFVAALIAAAVKQGAHVVEQADDIQLEMKSSTLKVTALGKEWKADQVVLTVGAWTGELSRTLGFNIPIEPVRGQILSYQTPQRLIPTCLHSSEGYIAVKEGLTLVGSTIENVGFDVSTTPAAIARLKAFGEGRIPALKSATFLKAAAGSRPGPLADGLPMIGKASPNANVWIASGHYRNGILLAPITALWLREKLLNDSPA